MTVVVGYRPDKYGEAALAEGVEQARKGDRRVVVVNASPGDSYVDSHFLSEAQCDELGARFVDVDVVVEQQVEADVSMAVVRAAERRHASMIVIGVRHRSSAGKMLLGSHAHRIIMEAPCPVLCAKPQA